MIDNKSDIDTAKALFLRLLKEELKLEPEYKRIREQRETIHTQITGLEQFLRAAKVDVDALRVTLKSTREAKAEEVESGTLPDTIARMLRNHGKPMHYREIKTALIDSGVDVPGKDPANTVNAYIRQNKSIFIKAPEMGRGYYKLSEWSEG